MIEKKNPCGFFFEQSKLKIKKTFVSVHKRKYQSLLPLLLALEALFSSLPARYLKSQPSLQQSPATA